MPKKDINETAFDVVRRATGEVVDPPESAKAKSGRKGGQKGGIVRATSLTAQERSEAARKAAAARWGAQKKEAGQRVLANAPTRLRRPRTRSGGS